MKRSIYTSSLTKEFIESKVSQEAIVSKYLGIPLEDVKTCIEKNALITSVFRDDDKNGSMGIQYNAKGRLKVRDFGGFGFFEDVYGTVAYVLSLVYERKIDTNNKQDFYFVLKHIAYTFSDLIDGKETDPDVEEILSSALGKGKKRKAIIDIVPRSWNKKDKKLWESWGISLNYLNTHFVLPIESYYINRDAYSKPKYHYIEKDPCYAYYLGDDSKGIKLFKLYFPLRNKHTELKFITNCNILEGILDLELDNYDYILITKSSKDRLSIGNHLMNNPLYGGARAIRIGIINLPSEGYELRQAEFNWLTTKLADDGKIISLLDFDATGRKGASYLLNNYNIPYIFITRGEFGLYNYKCKDFAELCETYTKEEINDFIKSTLIYVNEKYNNGTYIQTERESYLISEDNLPY